MYRIFMTSAFVIAWLPYGGLAEAQTLTPRVAESLSAFEARHNVEQFIPSPGGTSLRLVRGTLSTPANGSETDIVRELLVRRGELFGVHDVDALVERRAISLGMTRVVRFRQTVDGIPIVGAHLTALVDNAGQVRLVMQSLADATVIGEFMLEAEDASAIVADEVIRPAGRPVAEHAVAVYVPTQRGLIPAYAIYYGAVPALLSNWTVVIDASTGELLARSNHVQYDRTGLAWPSNPVASELEPVMLDSLVLEGQDCIADDSLPPTGPDGGEVPDESVPRLCTSRISTRNCWDFNTTIPVSIPGLADTELHSCIEYHMSVPNDAPVGIEEPDDDLENDFYYDDHRAELDYDYTTDHREGQDLFAEQHAFYHMERVYAYFQSFAPELFDVLREGQLMVSVNWRLPVDYSAFLQNAELLDLLDALAAARNPEGPLFGLDNAMYVSGGNLYGLLERPQSSIMLFQGRYRDFAYDADVIYHEFGHAVVGTVVDERGLFGTRRDAQGMHQLSFAMNEAYADFFSGALTDDAVMADYALSNPRDLAIRPRTFCTERLENEEHWDSAPYGEALWEIRSTLDPAAAEHAIFTALCTLTPDASFREGAAATVAAIEAEIGSEASDAAQAIFAQYGYDHETPCERVVELSEGEQLRRLILFSTLSWVEPLTPYAPSIVQIRSNIPAGTRQLFVTFEESYGLDDLIAMLSGTEVFPALLVRYGDEPIVFSETGEVTSNADVFITNTEADPCVYGGRQLVYHLDGEELPEGTVHLMVVNTGGAAGALADIEVVTTEDPPGTPPDCGGDADADADVDGDADADVDADGDGDGDADAAEGESEGPFNATGGGCDCNASQGGRGRSLRLGLLDI